MDRCVLLARFSGKRRVGVQGGLLRAGRGDLFVHVPGLGTVRSRAHSPAQIELALVPLPGDRANGARWRDATLDAPRERPDLARYNRLALWRPLGLAYLA